MQYIIHSTVTFFNERKSTMKAKNVISDVTIEGEMPSKENLERAILGDMAHKGKKPVMCSVERVFRKGESTPLTIYQP